MHSTGSRNIWTGAANFLRQPPGTINSSIPTTGGSISTTLQLCHWDQPCLLSSCCVSGPFSTPQLKPQSDPFSSSEGSSLPWQQSPKSWAETPPHRQIWGLDLCQIPVQSQAMGGHSTNVCAAKHLLCYNSALWHYNVEPLPTDILSLFED